jgi:hypothetical protein
MEEQGLTNRKATGKQRQTEESGFRKIVSGKIVSAKAFWKKGHPRPTCRPNTIFFETLLLKHRMLKRFS